ncbi:hypothetical protein N7532_009793 [Penicillium argentinense]|uniref:F-box domain-containing protein n=1 Tax=Penicillium argentinense TaxID=1131581 RepID=A0A9W9JXU9_9EURO|nr:uncharacterized protein N7532_009793 [Penicillium argentinense]KAJ5085022.1 hypothetical protein N7532_009793 [Penicillium argentinense]
MPLHSLPVEVLHIILHFVGSESLRKHEACCLLVSKWWCKLAEPVLLKDLVLNANRLRQIPERALERLKLFLQRLTIDMKHSPDWHADDGLNDGFIQLLTRCVHLTAFILRAPSQFDPDKPLAPVTNYLESWSPTSLFDALHLSTISDLVIDTCGSEFQSGVHVCPRIALKIPSLRSIRLRMHNICPRVLELERDSKIESIIINLSLKEPDRFHAGFSRHCTEVKSAYELYDDMVMAASNVARSQPGIKMLRILCHKHPYLEMMTRDCINGTQMILSDDSEDWGDDGLPDPDDEEISDQDLFTADSEDERL